MFSPIRSTWLRILANGGRPDPSGTPVSFDGEYYQFGELTPAAEAAPPIWLEVGGPHCARAGAMIRRVAQQTLHTTRLELVPLEDAHLQWELELDSDPEVMRYLSARASTRAEVEAAHTRRLAAARKVEGLGFWVGLVDHGFVGSWWLQPAHGPDQPDDPGVADLGYRLVRREWRKGLATEGALELVRHGFDDVGLNRIIAQTLSVNAASRAVMERVGLTYVRTYSTSMTDPVEGVEQGEVEYEMTRKQWTHLAT